jgi:hypothetical protein
MLQLLLAQQHVIAFFIFVSFNDLVPRHFFAGLFVDPLIADSGSVAAVDESKAQIGAPLRAIQNDRDVHQSE